LILLLIAVASLAGCKETDDECRFLDQGFLYPSPVAAADLLPAEVKDDTAMKAARRTVEACYKKDQVTGPKV
jgi:hypothetical protein